MAMRLPEGIYINNEETFGVCKFAALRRQRMVQDEEGNATEEVKERVYDLKCHIQGGLVSVGIPGDIPEKTFDYDTEVEIVNPVVDTVANVGFRRTEANWYVKADDIVLKGQHGSGRAPEKVERPADRRNEKDGKPVQAGN